MDGNVQHQVLKRLAFEYRDALGEERALIFRKILRRIDNLVLYQARKFLFVRSQLKDVDLQELYDIAIVGLYKGLESIKEEETGAVLQARLIAYMKSELKQAIRSMGIKRKGVQKVISTRLTVVPEETVWQELESEFLRKRFQKLIVDDVISSEELNLLTMRYVHGIRIKEIAERVGRTPWWVGKAVKDICNRIRWEWRRQGWEDG